MRFSFFFFNDTATTEIYTLSLHDALPISCRRAVVTRHGSRRSRAVSHSTHSRRVSNRSRSEEHTSELQSQSNLVCRLLLEKKKRRPSADTQQDDRTTSSVVATSVRGDSQR